MVEIIVILSSDFHPNTTSHPNNDRNLTNGEDRAILKQAASAQKCSVWNRIAEIDVKSVDIFMTRTTTRPNGERRIPAVARETCHAVVSHPVYTRSGISRRMINLPSRFEPPSYRHGYFNILKFHPKRAVYQNLRHKLRAATPPTPLALTLLTFCIPLGAEIARCPKLRRARFALALSFGNVEEINDRCLITVELIPMKCCSTFTLLNYHIIR